MAQALHDHTALLPVVTIDSANPILPGRSTVAAIEAGVFWAVAGGIKALVRQLLARAGEPRDREVFLAGGGAALLAPMMDTDVILWPEMTLEGLRLTAETLQ
jgi:pantothenate kinase type III